MNRKQRRAQQAIERFEARENARAEALRVERYFLDYIDEGVKLGLIRRTPGKEFAFTETGMQHLKMHRPGDASSFGVWLSKFAILAMTLN